MRATTWARWATCALAITITIPLASADRGKKSLADCTAFDQADKDEETVELTVHNTCTVPVDCSISWRLVCAPDSKKRRASHSGAAKLALTSAGAGSTQVSASTCGDDAWTIDSIQWSCQPNTD